MVGKGFLMKVYPEDYLSNYELSDYMRDFYKRAEMGGSPLSLYPYIESLTEIRGKKYNTYFEFYFVFENLDKDDIEEIREYFTKKFKNMNMLVL